jgi:hypothetical protein
MTHLATLAAHAASIKFVDLFFEAKMPGMNAPWSIIAPLLLRLKLLHYRKEGKKKRKGNTYFVVFLFLLDKINK